ncbi:MAG: leucyl/phenylalanyl-tRNA--protein transferase [Candidatus Nanopelagicales bacterium]
MPDARQVSPGCEVVAAGADLAPGTVLEGYRRGLFAMFDHGLGELLWWSPDPRGVILPGAVRPSRSLRRSARRLRVTLDADFPAVLSGCADPRRPGGWIDEHYQACYLALFCLGWAHSIEVRTPAGQLAGGLLCVEVGGLIAAESKFHVPGIGTDASKVAVLALSEALHGDPRRLIDVQWSTPHLASLGAGELSRAEYLQTRLPMALALPPALRAGFPRAAAGLASGDFGGTGPLWQT